MDGVLVIIQTKNAVKDLQLRHHITNVGECVIVGTQEGKEVGNVEFEP